MLNAAHRAQTAWTVLAVGIVLLAAVIGWSAQSCAVVDGGSVECFRNWVRTGVWWVGGALLAAASWTLGDAIMAIATKVESVHRLTQTAAE